MKKLEYYEQPTRYCWNCCRLRPVEIFKSIKIRVEDREIKDIKIKEYRCCRCNHLILVEKITKENPA